MPLFSRPDGDLVRDETPVRRIMPYLMRGRNESCVYQESVYRMAAARVWLKAYNRAHHPRATLFHLVAYAVAVTLDARPRLNRFVSGGRIYQRRGVSFSFVAKKEFTEEGEDATVKLAAVGGESFQDFSRRLSTQVDEARETERAVDREVALVMRLPGPLVRLLMALARGLDHWNLYPGFMIRDDPMYASIFLANLGSVGVSDVYHHLYEYGTVSIFGAVSSPRRAAFASRDGVTVEEALSVRWTFDERIDDAFSCARSLVLVQKILENPGRWLGPPEGTPAWRGVEADVRES
ncbi:2-oxo acid dehydrogenase subunit E2 [Geothrix edaphica]|uniref:2-oxoacid dehydrogenase acyltransferase catalytic domain-containing protein n=1 Tax=Geothrix edaphica TaxID=2927976 RepID=A0ABQ5Q0E3_9BACT|nr:2-oxo acid dehydrogenase subunit E2 [Geothrix edaphica]GLH67993.1 hypothetical protein GETHED_23570 [Geothrix edaphica]